MSEKNQKIFKIVVWVLLVVAIVVAIVVGVYSFGDTHITQEEWKQMLSDSFGDETLLYIKEDDELLTGKYAAKTVMYALGEDKIEYLKNYINEPEHDLLELALDFDVIKKSDFNKKLTSEEAKEILNNALSVVFSPEYYPEYCDIDYKEDVTDTASWQILNYDEEKDVLEFYSDEQPECNDIITFTNELGIKEIRRVTTVKSTQDGRGIASLAPIEDISEVIDEISFSGAASFDYVTENANFDSEKIESDESTPVKNNLDNVLSISPRIPFSTLESKWSMDWSELAVEKDELSSENSCDIEVKVEISSEKKKTTGKIKRKGTITAEISTMEDENVKTTKYKGEFDNKGKLSFSKTNNGQGLEISHEKDGLDSKDDVLLKATTSNSAIVKFEIKGLSIFSRGYIDLNNPDNPENNLEVFVEIDEITTNLGAKLKDEFTFKIAEFKVPIPATGGVVHLDLALYAVVSVNGEVSLCYTMNSPFIGFTYSHEDGLTPLHSDFGYEIGFETKSGLELGGIAEVALNLFDHALVDPSVEFKASVEASSLNIPENYELKQDVKKYKCKEIEIQLPIVKLNVTTGQDSLMYEILNKLKKDFTFFIIEKDSTKIKKYTYHFESNENGTINLMGLDSNNVEHESVCTRIQKIEEPPVIDENNSSVVDEVGGAIDTQLQEQESKLLELIEKKIEDILFVVITTIFVETCDRMISSLDM